MIYLYRFSIGRYLLSKFHIHLISHLSQFRELQDNYKEKTTYDICIYKTRIVWNILQQLYYKINLTIYHRNIMKSEILYIYNIYTYICTLVILT